jgi:hypothetical protein
MKTDALVDLLARSADPVDPGAASRRFLSLLLLAGAATAAVSLGLLGVRADWRDAAQLPMAWLKLGCPATTATIAGMVLWRLVHPGMRVGASLLALALPNALLWLLAARSLWQAAPAARPALVFGTTWWQCLVMIAALAAPALLLGLRAARQMAPTRLRLAGAMAGLAAGGVAAAAFSLYCTEMAAPYVAIWYGLGMVVPAVAGAVLGPRALRW